MKKSRIYWSYVCMIVIVFPSYLSTTFVSVDHQIDFDSPFRSGWYKKAVDVGAALWNELEVLSQIDKDTLMPDYKTLILDASVGRLSYLEYCMKKVFSELSDVDKRSPDFAYLAHIVREIENLVEPLSRIVAHDRFTCFQSILARINSLISLEE